MYNVLCGLLGVEIVKCFLLAALVYQVAKVRKSEEEKEETQ